MKWIKINSNKDIPNIYLTNRRLLLLKDEDGMIGVGYFDGYDWELNLHHDVELKIYFSKIIEYSELN